MNTIYRIIWNHAKGEWTVASELATASRGGKGKAQQNVHAPASILRRLPWALACVLGGLAVCVPAVHAGDAAASEHQRMEKINSQLADLSDLMVKYGDAQTQVADRVAPSEVATNPSVLPGQGMANATSRASVNARVTTQPAAATPTARRVVKTAMHVASAAHAPKPSTHARLHAAPQSALSPQLASDAQIAAALASRNEQASGRASTWVIGNDGSLHVNTGNAATPKPVARTASVSSDVQAAGNMAPDASPSKALPAIDVSRPTITDAPSAGRIAAVDAAVSAHATAIAGVQAPQSAQAPEAPAPRAPQQDSTSQLVADVSTPVSRHAASTQTSSLVLDTDPTGTNLSLAALGGTTVETREVATTDGQVAGTDGTASTHAGAGGSSFQTASVGSPERYAALDTDADTTDASQSAMTFSSADLSRSAFSSAALTPMALPPGDNRRTRPVETPAPGLIISNGGVVGGVVGLLGTTTNDLFNNADPDGYLGSGSLRVSNANFTQGYGVTSLLGIPVVNTTPVGGLLTTVDGTVLGGTGTNSHLTLIGGVTSGNYITNINNGAAGGLLGLLLPNDAPKWADTCLNILGLVKSQCWAVNAAQDYQVLMGDGASANGSKEVVIGTNASHTLPEVDADTVFPGDGHDDADNPTGVPTSDYEARLGHSVVIGDDASGTANAQTLIGAEATSDQPNSVALGYQSNADRGPLSGYTNAVGLAGQAQNSAGEVAVGSDGQERQITHVAAGTENHDAVNVMQVKGLLADSGKLSVKYDDDGTGNPSDTVTLIGDGTGPVTITNLAPGAVTPTSTDAVNGSQLNDTNTTIANYFGGATNYDGGTNTWTAPDFTITNIDNDGNTTTGDYNNVTDAFSALDNSVVNVNKRVTKIYDTGVKYFHANSTGADSTPTGADSIAVGPAAAASGDNGIAIGNGADASMADSVALGSGSATTVGAQTGYSAYGITAPQTSSGEVNVGNRQITGVAAGSADSDAVNVAQLKSVADTASNSVQYDDSSKTSVTLAGPVSADGGVTDGTSISNLHQGALSATSTDAVNGSQLYATNTTIATYLGGTTNYDGGTNTWTAPDFKITNIDLDGNGTVGDYDNVTDAFSALDTSLVNVNKRITNNSNGLKYFKANSTGADASADGADSVAMGGDTVAAGDGSVAAGNGAQAKTDGAVAIGQDASADGGQAVAIGNGAQASGDGAVSIGDPNVVAGDGAVGLGKDNTVTGDGAVAMGNTNTATGFGAIAMGNTSSATADGAVAIGNDAASSVAGGVALGEGSIASRSGGGNEAFTNIAVPTVGAVSVGAPDHLRQITNVAGGTEDTDAVNVRQLQAVADTVGDVDKLAVKYDADANGDPTNTVTLVGSGTGPILITNVAPGAITETSLDAINGAQLYDWTQSINNKYSNVNLYKYIQNLQGGGAFAVNDSNNLGDPTASGDNSAAGGAGTVAAGTDSTAVGNGAKATADNSVALGAGSVADRADTVSVGSKGHERQVTNVAAGTEDTDAVNVAQLNASSHGTVKYDTNKDGTTNYNSVTLGKPGGGGGATVVHNVDDGKADTDAVNVRQLSAVKDWAQQYSDQQYTNLSRQLNNMGKHAYAGVASAMAMAGLPQAYLPGKSMASIAASSFHGESSIAVGVSLISDNGRWVYKLNGTDSSRGDAGVSMGVGIQW